jgi:hypothetical protein
MMGYSQFPDNFSLDNYALQANSNFEIAYFYFKKAAD